MHAIVLLERRPDRLGRAAHLPRDPPRDLDQAGLFNQRHPPRPSDDLVALGVGQLPEPRPAIDLRAVRSHEPRQARLEESDLGPAVNDEPPRHQPLPPPSRHRPDRDVEPPAHRVDGQHRLGRLLGLLLDRRRKVLHEQPQVVPDVVAFEHQGGCPLGTEARDPEAEILVRVAPPGLDLRQELLPPVDLLQPPLPRREPGLLLLQLLQGRMAVAAPHPRRSSLGSGHRLREATPRSPGTRPFTERISPRRTTHILDPRRDFSPEVIRRTCPSYYPLFITCARGRQRTQPQGATESVGTWRENAHPSTQIQCPRFVNFAIHPDPRASLPRIKSLPTFSQTLSPYLLFARLRQLVTLLRKDFSTNPNKSNHPIRRSLPI